MQQTDNPTDMASEIVRRSMRKRTLTIDIILSEFSQDDIFASTQVQKKVEENEGVDVTYSTVTRAFNDLREMRVLKKYNGQQWTFKPRRYWRISGGDEE
jgi:hypothetical protein